MSNRPLVLVPHSSNGRNPLIHHSSNRTATTDRSFVAIEGYGLLVQNRIVVMIGTAQNAVIDG
jgi:hypothetical protein